MDPQQQIKAEQAKEAMIDSRLSLGEKDKLFAFCQDKAMVAAVEKAMLYGIYMMGTIKSSDKEIMDTNWAYAIPYNTLTSNEALGAAFRSKVEALTFLDDAFKQIKKYGDKPVELVTADNPAL